MTDPERASTTAQESARRTELMRLVHDSLNEIYVFDAETLRFLEINEAALSNLGYSAEEMRSLTPLDLKPEFDEYGFRRLIEPLRSGARQRIDFETSHRRKNGSLYPVEVHLQAGTFQSRPAFIALIMDITERKIPESRQADLVNIIENSLNEIDIFDESTLRFLEVNRAARSNLGYEIEELAKLTPVDIGPGFTLASFRQAVEPLALGEEGKLAFETRHRRKDGSTYPVEAHLQKGTFDQRPVFTAIVLDISERLEAESQRRALDLQVRKSQKLESLGVLAGNIAHDFNNLLTSIMGYADLARLESEPGTEAYRYMQAVTQGAQQAADLTGQTLAYSGKGKFVVGALNVSALIGEMNRLLVASISKNCELVCQLPPDPPQTEADPSQIRQLVLNLVVNASEAIAPNRGAITIRTGLRRWDTSKASADFVGEKLDNGEHVFIEISDTGHGLADAVRDRIFDPFFTTKAPGRGLGLAAILGIVRSHHGAIEVDSAVGHGTKFTVTLPITGNEPASKGPHSASPEDWQSTGTVLVVDDEKSVRELARQMLSRMGFTVLEAADGLEGVEVFRKHSDEIRLLLLDMTMPNLDGPGALQQMHAIRSDVPTLLASGYHEHTAVSQCTSDNLAGFVPKPFRYAQLLEFVRDALAADAQ